MESGRMSEISNGSVPLAAFEYVDSCRLRSQQVSTAQSCNVYVKIVTILSCVAL